MSIKYIKYSVAYRSVPNKLLEVTSENFFSLPSYMLMMSSVHSLLFPHNVRVSARIPQHIHIFERWEKEERNRSEITS